jgi:hypothetical protein
VDWLLKALTRDALATGGICRLGVDGRGRRHRLKHGLSLCHGLKHRLRDEHAVDAAWRPNRRGGQGYGRRGSRRMDLDGVGGRSMRPLPKLRQMSAIASC